jgi:hypothetical protein
MSIFCMSQFCFELGLDIEGVTSTQAEHENPGHLFRDVATIEHT